MPFIKNGGKDDGKIDVQEYIKNHSGWQKPVENSTVAKQPLTVMSGQFTAKRSGSLSRISHFFFLEKKACMSPEITLNSCELILKASQPL